MVLGTTSAGVSGGVRGVTSTPFEIGEQKQVAVKVIVEKRKWLVGVHSYYRKTRQSSAHATFDLKESLCIPLVCAGCL